MHFLSNTQPYYDKAPYPTPIILLNILIFKPRKDDRILDGLNI